MAWRQILRTNFVNIHKLLDFLHISEEDRKLIYYKPAFILNLPVRLAEKIEKGNIHDPLFRQFVPLIDEQKDGALDPVQDVSFKKSEKLLQKYAARALVVSTSSCAMHCRYCFRQNFPYETERKGFDQELEIIKNDVSLREIILSGGDPLSLPNHTLESFLDPLNKFNHIKKVRFHSRFPIGIPERLDEGFLSLIRKINKSVYFVVHINHARELDRDILDALKRLKNEGVTLLNQSVLLKGVNDDFNTMKELFETLSDEGILPYYLHQLDLVKGAAHFEVDKAKGLELIQELTESLPGYAVPKYVAEIPFKKSKTPLTSSQ